MVDCFCYYDQILDANFSDTQLAHVFSLLGDWDISLSFETGVLYASSETGEGAFDDHEGMWTRFQSCGANIDEFAINESYFLSTHGTNPGEGFYSEAPYRAVMETADWIYLVREMFPNNGVRIGSIEPYPALSVEEIEWWIDSLQSQCHELGIRGIDFFALDPNWAWTGAFDWQDVLDIREYCADNDIPFDMIYWSADAVGPQYDDEDWYDGILTEGQDAAFAGLAPDRYCIQSWLWVPQEIIPDSGENYSFTHSVLDFYNTFIE